MRVLFVYPNLRTQMGLNHGLASLSACLKERGHETRLVNLNEKLPPVPSKEDVVEMVREWRPGMVAFSCLTQQYGGALELARYLREELEQPPPIVVGGVHATMVPTDVMEDGVWDHVGVGECEDALVELVERIEGGEAPDDVRNFLSWKGGERASRKWVHNPVGEFSDLHRLPIPDYDLFDAQAIADRKQGWFGLLSSRGCPYRCTYCQNHELVERYRTELGRSASGIGFCRFRPADRLIEEIRWVLDRYDGIRTLIFDDDLFTHDVDHALAVCAAYEQSGIGMPFVVNSHVKRLDPRVGEALARAGCRILKLGIESGSSRVRREVLRRFMTNADVIETVAVGERCGLHTSGFVMTGLPYETRDERWETVDLLAESQIGRFRTSLFYPFPGTESHRLAEQGGFVREDVAATVTDFTESSCLDFGPEENLFIRKLAACMPWFVNERLDRFRPAAAAARYRPLVERVLAMDAGQWAAFAPTVGEVDGELSAAACAAGELHYAIRFNAFMGVRSDYRQTEETGVEWASVQEICRA